MGKGIDLAGGGPHAALLDDFKDQLLIVMLKRLSKGGKPVVIPVAEVDDTGQDVVSFSVVDRAFHFVIGRKN